MRRVVPMDAVRHGFVAAAFSAALSLFSSPLAAGTTVAAPKPSARPTVLIIPFMNKSAAEFGWMGQGAAEVIAAEAVVSNAVNVVPISAFNGWLRKRDLTADAARSGEQAIEAAHALGADFVISGSVQATWPDVGVSAWAIDVKDGNTKKHADTSGRVEHVIALFEQMTAEIFKSEGWPAPKPGAVGTTNVYAFRDAAIGLEILSLQTFGPLQKSLLPQGSLKRAKLNCEHAAELDKKWAMPLGCLAAAEALLGAYDRAADLSDRAKGAQGFSAIAPLAGYYARFQRGDKDKALATVRAAADAHPGYLAYLACAGEHAQSIDDHAQARKIFERYLEIAPDNPYALVKLGKSLARTGEGEAALAATKKALERAPKDVAVLVELGSREIDLNHLPEAEATLLKAIAADKRDARAYLRLGYLYLLEKKPDKAVGILQQSIAQANLDEEWRVKAVAYYDLARAHAQAKAKEEAFKDLDQAIAGGFDDKAAIEKEGDFEALRADPRWGAMLARLR